MEKCSQPKSNIPAFPRLEANGCNPIGERSRRKARRRRGPTWPGGGQQQPRERGQLREQPTVESVRAARQGKTLNLPLPGKGQRDCRLTNGARLMGTAMMVRHKPQSTQRPPHRTAGPPAPPVRPYPPPPSRNPAAAPANTRRVPRCAGSQRRSPAPAPAPVGCPPAAAAPPPTGTLSNRAPAPRRTAAFFGSDHRPARAA